MIDLQCQRLSDFISKALGDFDVIEYKIDWTKRHMNLILQYYKGDNRNEIEGYFSDIRTELEEILQRVETIKERFE